MSFIHDDKTFVMGLIAVDLQGDGSKEEFAGACETARRAMEAHDIGGQYRQSYRRKAAESDEALLSQVQTDLWDNYMVAAFVCMEMGIPKDLPLIAWASMNRRDFPSINGEIACMRALMWGGYDVNAKMSGGVTALHTMCNLKWGAGAHPRAVFHLIENGADVNARSDSGDTPIITLCGNGDWTEGIDEAFKRLFNAGADMELEANDGTSAWRLLQSQQKANPVLLREQLIDELAA